MLESFWSDKALFICLTISSAAETCVDTMRNRLLDTAMTNEAGTPLPETSPTQKNSFSSRI